MRKVVAAEGVSFDYETRVWRPKNYDLPFAFNDYVLLAPREILTKDDNWINRHDLFDRFEEIVNAMPDGQLRSQVNQYLRRQLSRRSTKGDQNRAYGSMVHQ